MKQSITKQLLLMLLVLALCNGTSIAANKRFKLELFGGLALLNPADLNTLPQYDQAYEEYFSVTRYNYYHNRYGQFFTFTEDKQGELKQIEQAPALGARLKYRLSGNWWLSLGFKYMKKEEISGFNYMFIVHSIDPDAVVFDMTSTITRRNDPYSLEVKSYSPMLGIHYQLGEDRFINLEGFITAGPVFGSTSYFKERLYHEIDQYGYWYQRSSSTYMEGNGTGIAAEVGLQINVRIFKGFRFFVEGSYAYQRTGKISGKGSSQTAYADVFSEGYINSSTWEGDWIMLTSQLEQDWGDLFMPFPANWLTFDNPTYFKLDLSGLQLRAGLSITF